MNDVKIPVFAKKKVISELIEFNKNHKDKFSKSDLEKITFDKKVLKK